MLVDKIKRLRSRWGVGGFLDAKDSREFRKNAAGWRGYGEEDWEVVGEFMRARLPEGTAYCQPKLLRMALGMPAALLADALDWKEKQVRRPVLKVVESSATEEDAAALAEFLKPRRVNS